MKICLAASAGGHMTQLLQLVEVCEGKAHFFVTTEHVMPAKQRSEARAYVVQKANYGHPFRLVRMLVQCISIMHREQPDVVISTGAAVGCILCILAKLKGKTIIWIDTISHVDRLTISGMIIRHFADLFFVQWPHLAERYERTKYVGALV